MCSTHVPTAECAHNAACDHNAGVRRAACGVTPKWHGERSGVKIASAGSVGAGLSTRVYPSSACTFPPVTMYDFSARAIDIAGGVSCNSLALPSREPFPILETVWGRGWVYVYHFFGGGVLSRL